MRKIFTLLLLGLSLLAWPAMAQDVDMSYVFIDEEGNIIEDGATVICNQVETFDEESEVIYSGISVLNLGGDSNDYLKVLYTVQRIDNGTYQICFPSTCNMQTEAGIYETGIGQLMSDLQDIQSEWFPSADGECIVTLSIEIYMKQGLFPPSYVLKGQGPTMTLRFIKGDVPGPEPLAGDVNGDGEVSISDVNALIDSILSGAAYQEAADVNKDGEVGISDVNAVIDIILNV